MKLLVVDDDHSFAALLGRALKRLGNQYVIATHPNDALEAYRAGGIEAVITDVEMPEMSGLELAALLRGEKSRLPIAFCTASDSADRERAAMIGPVLPKVWTVAVLKDVVAALEVLVRQVARGSASDLPTAPVPTVPEDAWVEPWTATSIPEVDLSDVPKRTAAGSVAPPIVPRPGESIPMVASPRDLLATEDMPPVRRGTTRSRPSTRKIRVSCKSWEHVQRLCVQKAAGKNVLTIRGTHGLTVGEQVVVALALPDELVLSLPAEVIAVKPQPDGTSVFGIALVGLTAEICSRLEVMVAGARTAPVMVRPRRGLVIEPRQARTAMRAASSADDSEVSA